MDETTILASFQSIILTLALVGKQPLTRTLRSMNTRWDNYSRSFPERNETADMVAIPLLFLMRHTMELGYKSSISKLCALNGYCIHSGGKELRRPSLCKPAFTIARGIQECLG